MNIYPATPKFKWTDCLENRVWEFYSWTWVDVSFLSSCSRLVMAPPQWPCWLQNFWNRWNPTWRKACTRRSSSELSAPPHSWYGSASDPGPFVHLFVSLRVQSILGCRRSGDNIPWIFSEFYSIEISVLPFSSYWLGVLLSLFKLQVFWQTMM